MHSADQPLPRLSNNRRVCTTIKVALIDPPRYRVTEKARATGFGNRCFRQVEQTWSPQPISTLKLTNSGSHFLQQLDVTLSIGIVLRKMLQDANRASHYPTIAACPKNLFAIRIWFSDVVLIAVIEVLSRIKQKVSGVPPHRIQILQILLITCCGVQPRQDRWRHEERITPPPIYSTGFGIGDHCVKRRLCCGNALRILIEQVKLKISLTGDLVVSVTWTFSKFPVAFVRPLQCLIE